MSTKLEVFKVDKLGPVYSLKTVINVVADELESNNCTFLMRGTRMVTSDMQRATHALNEAERMFSKALDNYHEKTRALSAASKKCSGDVRAAADSLASGLTRLEKTANFNNLERYVVLLERAATALQVLSDLEDAGKLHKIAGALK